MNTNLVVYEIPFVRVISTADSLDYIRSEVLIFLSAPENVSDSVLLELLYREHPLLVGQQPPQQDGGSCTPNVPFGIWQPALSRRRVVTPAAVQSYFQSY